MSNPSIYLEAKLNNPVYHALNETHHHYAIDYNTVKFYHPDFCPFGGFIDDVGMIPKLKEYSRMVDTFFIVGNKPTITSPLHIQFELVCLQMILDYKITIAQTTEIVPLGEEHAAALFELVNLVQPGYFKQKTRLLGNYFGIFINGALIAAAGERMKMTGFTEISAVVTHPQFTGLGYAKQLVAHTVNQVIEQGTTPFLHVSQTNVAAIALYKKLGFTTRRTISFWNIKPL